MNPIVVSLEVLLAVLLLATLFFGIRLERKLKALRQSQAGFASAVRDLDAAAHRTETGLDALRHATEDARTVLVQRMEAAQAMALRLEQITGEAEAAALAAETAAVNAAQSAARLAALPPPRSQPEPPPSAVVDFEARSPRAEPSAERTLGPVLPPAGSRLREAAATEDLRNVSCLEQCRHALSRLHSLSKR